MLFRSRIWGECFHLGDALILGGVFCTSGPPYITLGDHLNLKSRRSRFPMGKAWRGGSSVALESRRGVLDRHWPVSPGSARSLHGPPASSRLMDPMGVKPSPRLRAPGVSLALGGVPGILPELPVATSPATRALKARSEERRVGKECLRLCRSRWSPYH